MAEGRLPLSSNNSSSGLSSDPFSDRPRQIHFNDPDNLSTQDFRDTMPRPFDSQTHLPSAGGHDYDDDEYLEKQPLNVGQSFTGGFYPPQYVSFKYICLVLFSIVPCRAIEPNNFGEYTLDRPGSVVSTSTNGIENAWRRRQTLRRGKTRKVKLTNGNFIAEYPVPTPVFSAMEEKWTSTNTTEFS